MACVSSPVTAVMLLCIIQREEKFLISGNTDRIFISLASPSRGEHDVEEGEGTWRPLIFLSI